MIQLMKMRSKIWKDILNQINNTQIMQLALLAWLNLNEVSKL